MRSAAGALAPEASNVVRKRATMAKTPLRFLTSFAAVPVAVARSVARRRWQSARRASSRARVVGPDGNAACRGSRSAAQRHLRIQGRDDDRPRRQLPFLQRALQSLRAARRGTGIRAGAQDPGRPHLDPPRRRDQARSPGRGRVGQRDGRADRGAARDRQHDVAHRHRQVLHPAGPGGGAHARDGGDRDLDAGLRPRRERPLSTSRAHTARASTSSTDRRSPTRRA